MILLTYQPAMPTMTQMPRRKRVPTGLWPGLIAATLIGLHAPVSAQFSATPLRVLEAQAGIPYGDVATAQASDTPAATATATATAAAADNAAPPPAMANNAPPAPTTPAPAPTSTATSATPAMATATPPAAGAAPMSPEDKKIAAMRALLGADARPPAAQQAMPTATAKPATNTDEAQLTAIREALIERALEGPTRVVSTAWIDDQGRLHEDAQLTNDMRVRGVRVLSYTADGKASLKAEVDLQSGEKPVCAAPDASRWTQHVRLLTRIAADTRPEDRYFANEIMGAWQVAWRQATANYAKRWQQSDLDLTQRSAYQAALMGDTGLAPADQGQWRLTMTLGKFLPLNDTADGEAPAEAGNGALAKQWQLSLRLEPIFGSAEPSVKTISLIWARAEATLTPPQLPDAVATKLVWEAEKWVQTLNERMACEPLQFAMRDKEGERLHISGGRFNGLKVGDKLVLVDSRELPARVLHAGVAARLALAEVSEVADTESVLRQVAGPPLGDALASAWVAMPYQ